MLRSVNEKVTRWKLTDCRKSKDYEFCIIMKERCLEYERQHGRFKTRLEGCMNFISTDSPEPNMAEGYYACVKGVEKSYKELTKYYFNLLNE